MGYIKPPEPADDVVLIPGQDGEPDYTWGDQRQMEKWLQELEEDNPAIKVAREKLEAVLDQAGLLGTLPELVCQFCWRKESEPHEVECPDHNDPAMWVKREAGGYQYMDANFRVVHTTSVPMTDDEALGYFGIVQMMFPHESEDFHVKYILRREVGGTEYKMMPYTFDKETWGVSDIVRSGS